MVYINNKVEKQENGLYVDREIDYAEAVSRWKIHDLENNRLISPYSAHPMFMVQVYNGAIPLDSDQFTVKWSMRGDDFNSAEMPNYITFEPVVYEGDDNSLVGLNGEKTNGTCFLRIRHIKGRRVVGSVEYKKDESVKHNVMNTYSYCYSLNPNFKKDYYNDFKNSSKPKVIVPHNVFINSQGTNKGSNFGYYFDKNIAEDEILQ